MESTVYRLVIVGNMQMVPFMWVCPTSMCKKAAGFDNFT